MNVTTIKAESKKSIKKPGVDQWTTELVGVEATITANESTPASIESTPASIQKLQELCGSLVDEKLGLTVIPLEESSTFKDVGRHPTDKSVVSVKGTSKVELPDVKL